MSLTVSLDGQAITGQISDLRIKSVSPGGFASVMFNLNRKLDKALLQQFTDVLVYDESTGEQVGGGRLLDQGRNDDGTWSVSCLGEGLASMQDTTSAYMLIDSNLDRWEQYARSNKRLNARAGTRPDSAQAEAFVFTADDGAVANGADCRVRHAGPRDCNQLLGGYGFTHIEGANSGSRHLDLRASKAGGGSTSYEVDNWTTGNVTSSIQAGTDFTDKDAAILYFSFSSAFTAGDNAWSSVENPWVAAQRLDQARALITGSTYTNAYVLLHQAFIDLVARFCPRLDIANARVDSGAYQFDQLAWYDGITPLGVMEDMLGLESDFAWHAWEKTSSGLWATELVQLPAAVRYEASAADGFTAPSPSSEVYNAVTVRYRNKYGNTKAVRVTSTVPALSSQGVVREAFLDLADEIGSANQAQRRGEQFLAAHANPPNAGTLTIARRILDDESGRWVQPWNIRAGGLIRVRGVQPTADTLNGTAPDGATVFRIVTVEYAADAGTAILELDAYTLTESRAIARLDRKRNRKR